MTSLRKVLFTSVASVLLIVTVASTAYTQETVRVLTGVELTRVVPPGFYFQGLSAPTQVRNSAAARFSANRYVVAGMVDTTGYAADVRAKYEGFLITDSPITIGGSELPPGAYGFGFSNDGKLNILDLSGTQILSISTIRDSQLKRPRPLLMTKSGGSVRLYSGRDYAEISAR